VSISSVTDEDFNLCKLDVHLTYQKMPHKSEIQVKVAYKYLLEAPESLILLDTDPLFAVATSIE
jgi:hypothetical protein